MDIIQFSNQTDLVNYTLLDVRTNEERKNGYLLNSTHIDYYDKRFLEKIDLLDKNKPQLHHCLELCADRLQMNNIVQNVGFYNE